MKIQAKTIGTPVGIFPAPLNPHFVTELENCETKEDLFKIVMQNGHVVPDAINEVIARNWYDDYVKWTNDDYVKRQNAIVIL